MTPAEKQRAMWMGIASGFFVGFAVAAVVASFVAWAVLMKRQKDLASEYEMVQVVVTKKPMVKGEPFKLADLGQKLVPRGATTENTVMADEVGALIDRVPVISFQEGDILIDSAFVKPQ